MAKLKFPHPKKIKVMSFHYEVEKNPSKVLIQIPNADYTDSDSYRFNFENATDMKWLSVLKNWQELYDAIRMYGNVLYFPSTGQYQIMENGKDASSTTNRIRNTSYPIEREYGITWRPHTRLGEISALRREKSKQSKISKRSMGIPFKSRF